MSTMMSAASSSGSVAMPTGTRAPDARARGAHTTNTIGTSDATNMKTTSEDDDDRGRRAACEHDGEESSSGGSVRMMMTMRERMTTATTATTRQRRSEERPGERHGEGAPRRGPSEDDDGKVPIVGRSTSASVSASASARTLSGSEAGSMQSTTLVGSLLSQIQKDSNSERLFALRALRELTCHDDRARRLVVSLPNGCDALVACCNGGMNALVTELSEAGTSAWETMVQLQAMYVSCFAWLTRSTQSLHIMPASKANYMTCTRS